MRTRLTISAVAIAALGCSNSTAPSGRAPLSFDSGNDQSDTIETVLAQPLVVRLSRVPSGQSVANQEVQFASIPFVGSAYRAFMLPPGATYRQASATATTNASGVAQMTIVLGVSTGIGRTAQFTVSAGHAVTLRALPFDTAAFVGNAVALENTGLDTYQNATSDTVKYTLLSGPGTLSGSTVSVTGYGPITIRGTVGALQDTTTVYGVPKGMIAAAGDAAGIFTFNADGSHYTELITTYVNEVKWSPDGAALVYDQLLSGPPYVISKLTLGGQVSTLASSTNSLAFPTYSRDGTRVYYVMGWGPTPLWHVHPDGTGDSLVYMQSPESMQYPSPSSDGTQLAYVATYNFPGELKVLTLATGAATDLGVVAMSAAWSPTSNVIAYVDGNNNLATVHSDGSGQATIATGQWSPQIDWSPDGQWILGRGPTGKITIVNATSGLMIPLFYTRTVMSPTWH
jgi:Tol biopolymer transport system component